MADFLFLCRSDSHHGWIKDINETQGVNVDFPIVADPRREISNLYGMIDQTEMGHDGLPATVRAVFVIDPAKIARLIIIYPASCGRNFDEIVRVIDSLQLSSKHRVTTPANWRPGDDVIIAPPVKDEEASQLFGEFRTLRPYLRLTKQPK